MSSTNATYRQGVPCQLREPDDGHGLLRVRPGRQCSADSLQSLAATCSGHSISTSIRCAPSSGSELARRCITSSTKWILPDSNSLAACEEFLSCAQRSGCGYRTLPINLSGSTGMARATSRFGTIGVAHRLADRSGISRQVSGPLSNRYLPGSLIQPCRSKDRVNCGQRDAAQSEAGRRRLLIDPGC